MKKREIKKEKLRKIPPKGEIKENQKTIQTQIIA